MSAGTLTHSALAIETIGLKNGATLYYQQLPGAPRIALNAYLFGGNRIEPYPGVADMIDDLTSEGTQRRSSEQLAVELDGLSLDSDMDTRRDYSVMSSTFLEEDLEASADILSDMLFQSTLADFEKEKIRLGGELMMDLDSPRNQAHDILMTAMMADTPYQASHSNMLNTLQTLTDPGPLQQHYQQIYHPKNMIFTLVGDVSPETVTPVIERYFIRNTASMDNYADTSPPKKPALKADAYLTAPKPESAQLHLFKGWFAPDINDDDYAPMVVLNTILGGAGLTSRLFLELRDKQGLAYVVRSQYEASKYLGLFSLYIGTDPNNRQKALTGFDVECRKLMDTFVGEKELAEAKENTLGRKVVFLETASQQASYIGGHMALGATPDKLKTDNARIQAVTAADVQRVAQTILSKPSVTSAVGPPQFL